MASGLFCWLAVSLLLLGGKPAMSGTDTSIHPNIARIGLFIYPWDDDGVIDDDQGYGLVQELMGPLAVLMFNERRADILPVLGTLGNCNKNLSIPYMCATAGSPRLAFGQMLELEDLDYFPHFV